MQEKLVRGGIALQWGSATTVGKIRQVNEDSFLAMPGVYIVADGMGGHAAGDVASKLAVETFSEIVTGEPLSLATLAEVVSEANARIRSHAQHNGLDGMGTTLVGALLVDNAGDDSIVVFNIGDARCYAYTSGRLEQLTSDHSLIQELIDQGELPLDQARSHPQRNVVTRALGIEVTVTADFVIAPVLDATRLLLCSDGVHGEVGDDELAALLSGDGDAQTAADAIISAVMEGDARDNATALVLDVIRGHGNSVETDIEVTGPRPASLLSPPTRVIDGVPDSVEATVEPAPSNTLIDGVPT